MSIPGDTRKYLPRVIDAEIEKELSCFGAVSIEGPDGCGKTTTALRHCKSGLYLDDAAATGNPARSEVLKRNASSRQFADASPGAVLKGPVPRLVDEWELVPALWDTARFEIDRRAEYGQFVFTQSARPFNLTTYHPGTGRISRLRMETMTLYETGDSSGEVSFRELCDGKMESSTTRRVTLDDIMRYIIRGGWPEAVTRGSDTSEIPMQYLFGVTDGCARERVGARYGKTNMELMLRSLARHEGTAAPTVAVANDVSGDGGASWGGTGKPGVDRVTAAKYLDILDRLYLTENTPPFRPTSNIKSSVRVKRDDIRRFCDVSLACACLGMTRSALMDDYATFARLFESLCVHDIRVYAESFGASVFYYRDYNGQEIDSVIELKDGRWCAFDIVISANQVDRTSDRLVRTCRSLEKAGMTPPSALGVICGLSSAAYRRDDGVFAVPLTALRP